MNDLQLKISRVSEFLHRVACLDQKGDYEKASDVLMEAERVIKEARRELHFKYHKSGEV